MSQAEMLQAAGLAEALEDVTHVSMAVTDYLARLAKPESPRERLELCVPWTPARYRACGPSNNGT